MVSKFSKSMSLISMVYITLWQRHTLLGGYVDNYIQILSILIVVWYREVILNTSIAIYLDL